MTGEIIVTQSALSTACTHTMLIGFSQSQVAHTHQTPDQLWSKDFDEGGGVNLQVRVLQEGHGSRFAADHIYNIKNWFLWKLYGDYCWTPHSGTRSTTANSSLKHLCIIHCQPRWTLPPPNSAQYQKYRDLKRCKCPMLGKVLTPSSSSVGSTYCAVPLYARCNSSLVSRRSSSPFCTNGC